MIKSEIKIRRSIKELSSLEIEELEIRVNLLKTQGRYEKFLKLHMESMNMGYCNGPVYLPWNRKFLLEFEREMGMVTGNGVLKNPNFMIPFWDWQNDSQNDFIKRNTGFIPTVNDSLPIVNPSNYSEFRENLEANLHGNQISIDDPVYWLHHCNIDRIWSQWQQINPIELDSITSSYPKSGLAKGHNLNDPMPLWNSKSRISPATLLNFASFYKYSDPAISWPNKAWNIMGNDILLSSPVIFNFKNHLHMVYRGTNQKIYYVCKDSSQDLSWHGATHILGSALTSSNPSVTEFQDKIFIGFRGTNQKLYIASSSTMPLVPNPSELVTWPSQPTPILENDETNYSPSLASYHGRLYLSFRGTNNKIYLSSSDDGTIWPKNSINILENDETIGSPSLFAFKDTLFLVFRGLNNKIYLASSSNGSKWSKSINILPQDLTLDSPMLNEFNNKLYIVYQGTDNYIYSSSSVDSINWDPTIRIVSNVETDNSPTITSFNNKMYLAFKGINDKIYLSFTN